MEKIAPAVKKETSLIALVSLLLSALMQGVFLILGYWDLTVLLGNLLGYTVAVGNFFLMALTVQKAVEKDPGDAKSTLRLSQNLRYLMLIVFAAIAYLAPCFHLIAFVICYLFPRIAIALRPIFIKD